MENEVSATPKKTNYIITEHEAGNKLKALHFPGIGCLQHAKTLKWTNSVFWFKERERKKREKGFAGLCHEGMRGLGQINQSRSGSRFTDVQ